MMKGDLNKDSELVLGIIHTVGTNSTEVIRCIIDSLQLFHYNSEIIKVSKEILSQFVTDLPRFSNEYERISFFMDKGNEIRKSTEDDAILMKGVCAWIYHKEISQEDRDKNEKVVFVPFEGVGPHRFTDLFSMQSIRWYARKRKDKKGHVIEWKRNTANLRNPMALLNYIEMEKSASKQYAEEILSIGKEDEDGKGDRK